MLVAAWRDKDGKPVVADGKPSWHLRWDRKNPGTGKREYIHETFHGSQRDARKRWVEREAEIRQAGAGYVKAAKTTVGEYMERWLRDYCEQHLKPTTVASYRALVRGHIIPGLGAVPLADLSAAQVAAWQAEVARKQTGRGGDVGEDGKRAAALLSPRRVAYARAVLRAALHDAQRQRLIPSNPVELVRAPKQDPKQVEAFTLAEVQALDAAAEGNRLAVLIRTAWRTGLRMGELLALRWEGVDADHRTLTVRGSLVEVGGRRILQESTKTKKGTRSVAMTGTVAADMKAHRARQAAERLAAGEGWQDHGLVFCTGQGKPLAPRNVMRSYYTVRDAAGIPAHGFHALRHTYATLSKRAGVPIEDIADALGHETPAFTAKVYAHVLPEGRRDNADRFEAFTTELVSGAGLGQVRAGEPGKSV